MICTLILGQPTSVVLTRCFLAVMCDIDSCRYSGSIVSPKRFSIVQMQLSDLALCDAL